MRRKSTAQEGRERGVSERIVGHVKTPLNEDNAATLSDGDERFGINFRVERATILKSAFAIHNLRIVIRKTRLSRFSSLSSVDVNCEFNVSRIIWLSCLITKLMYINDLLYDIN